MVNINLGQSRQIKLLFGIITALAGGLSIFIYVQKIKHDKSQRELNALEKEIKTLQLAEIKNKANQRD